MDDRPRQTVSWTKILGWILSLVALVFVIGWIRQVDPTVWRYLQSIDVRWLVVSLVIFQAWFGLRYWGWQYLSRRFGVSDAHHSNLKMWTLSELMRYIPGNIWSFAARYRGARDRGASRGGAWVAIVLEGVFLAGGAAVLGLGLWYPGWWPVAIVVVGLLVWFIPIGFRAFERWRQWPSSPGLTPVVVFRLLCLYVGVWALFGAAQAVMMSAIPGLDLPSFQTLLAANVLAWLIGYVSLITPTGLGVREVAFVTLLKTVPMGIGSLLAVTSRVWMILTELFFLALVLGWPRRK